MREILTPDEIEALTAAFEREPAPSRRDVSASVRVADLANQERSLEGRLPGLEIVLDRFARGLRTLLATSVGEVPSVTTAMLGLVRFERLGARLAEPAALVRFRLAPLRGYGILAVPTSLVGVLLQASCGGAPSGTTPLPSREFSPIELRLIERLAARMLAELGIAWAPITAVECSLVRVEANPLFAKIAAPEELVVHAELTVVSSRLPPTTLSLLVPNASLDPVRARLQAVRSADDGVDAAPDAAWAAGLRDRLLEVPVDVVVDLGTTALTMSRVLGLAVGDVLPLETGREGPVVVRAGGAGRLVGAPGVQNGNNAVQITARR